MAESTWTHLLGLPLAQAETHLRRAGAAYRIVPTCAPKRDGAKGRAPEAEAVLMTRRVIRVTRMGDAIELVTGDFPDGDPKQA